MMHIFVNSVRPVVFLDNPEHRGTSCSEILAHIMLRNWAISRISEPCNNQCFLLNLHCFVQQYGHIFPLRHRDTLVGKVAGFKIVVRQKREITLFTTKSWVRMPVVSMAKYTYSMEQSPS